MKHLAIAVFVVGCVSAAPQQTQRDFCAVTLDVRVASGGPLASGTAQLLDYAGAAVQEVRIQNGRGEFCDFGFGFYSIRVLPITGLPVTLSGVRLIYGVEQHLEVTVNAPVDRGTEGGGGNACLAYVRVVGSSREPVPGATVTIRGSVSRTDGFGRLLLLVPIGQFAAFRFEKPGYKPQEQTFSCNQWQEQIERTVTLVP